MIATLTSERPLVRFGVTLGANAVRATLSFAGSVIVARSLGAARYGDLNFLLATFAAFGPLLDMGTSSAFYTFLARRRRNARFFALYFGWLAAQFLATLVVIGLLLPRGLVELVWVGHDRGIVLLAFGTSFAMSQVWGAVSQLGEAVRRTFVVQAVGVVQALAHVVLVAGAAWLSWLTVAGVMVLLVAEHAVLVMLLGPRLLAGNVARGTEDAESLRDILRGFRAYCAPLVVYGWVGVVYNFADRWLLQLFGGAEQQGFFSVAQQFSTVSLLATTSVLKVFWKEVADARERRDMERIERLYRSTSRGLFFSAAWISFLLIPYSRDVLRLAFGEGYAAGWLVFAVALLFPIYQALGQVTGVLYYATENTALSMKLDVLMMAISVPATVVILAPSSAVPIGLGLGAVGLAAKTFLIAAFGVNLKILRMASRYGWRPDWRHQAGVLVFLMVAAWGAKTVADLALASLGMETASAVPAVVGATLYAGVSLLVLWRVPALVGLAGRPMFVRPSRLRHAG